jgi:hypothetical protein
MDADAPRAPGEVAGILIVRARYEPGTSKPGLRARVSARLRVDEPELELATTSDVDDVIASVRTWLDDFVDGMPMH